MDSLIPFTTSGSLVDCVDSTSVFSISLNSHNILRKMLVVLRDGRKLQGVLRSYDQFANLVLEDTVERIYHQNMFAEQKCGLFLIRGENVVLLGEVDLDQEDDVPLRQVDWDTLAAIHQEDIVTKKARDEFKAKVLYEQRGFCKEGGEGDGY
ncbi:hypothetical protein NM688_g9094 [Phlebia brevispora]|uniref:Uncharacterized protein n=1 Tax=Phlebia brevispora TaxID=194682 RepID=A0ACC1RLA5_9APHY|nr:hypothetical protein NM688_g9094 [Phlebia brevispora]